MPKAGIEPATFALRILGDLTSYHKTRLPTTHNNLYINDMLFFDELLIHLFICKFWYRIPPPVPQKALTYQSIQSP